MKSYYATNVLYLACIEWAYRKNDYNPLNETDGVWRGRFVSEGNEYEIVINPHSNNSNEFSIPANCIHVTPIAAVPMKAMLKITPFFTKRLSEYSESGFERGIRAEFDKIVDEGLTELDKTVAQGGVK